jgi:hypothetical protein
MISGTVSVTELKASERVEIEAFPNPWEWTFHLQALEGDVQN